MKRRQIKILRKEGWLMAVTVTLTASSCRAKSVEEDEDGSVSILLKRTVSSTAQWRSPNPCDSARSSYRCSDTPMEAASYRSVGNPGPSCLPFGRSRRRGRTVRGLLGWRGTDGHRIGYGQHGPWSAAIRWAETISDELLRTHRVHACGYSTV